MWNENISMNFIVLRILWLENQNAYACCRGKEHLQYIIIKCRPILQPIFYVCNVLIIAVGDRMCFGMQDFDFAQI